MINMSEREYLKSPRPMNVSWILRVTLVQARSASDYQSHVGTLKQAQLQMQHNLS